jgi:hypothetical protein
MTNMSNYTFRMLKVKALVLNHSFRRCNQHSFTVNCKSTSAVVKRQMRQNEKIWGHYISDAGGGR